MNIRKSLPVCLFCLLLVAAAAAPALAGESPLTVTSFTAKAKVTVRPTPEADPVSYDADYWVRGNMLKTELVDPVQKPIERERAGSDRDEDHWVGSRFPRYVARRLASASSGHWTYSRSAIGATSLADSERPSVRVMLST